MKTFACLLLLCLAGCGEKTGQSAEGTYAPAAGGNPLNAPGDYLRGIAQGQQSAERTVDVTSLDKAIQMFNVDQGRNPKDLNELVEKKYIPKIPKPPYGTKLVYDAGTGTVKVEKNQ